MKLFTSTHQRPWLSGDSQWVFISVFYFNLVLPSLLTLLATFPGIILGSLVHSTFFVDINAPYFFLVLRVAFLVQALSLPFPGQLVQSLTLYCAKCSSCTDSLIVQWIHTLVSIFPEEKHVAQSTTFASLPKSWVIGEVMNPYLKQKEDKVTRALSTVDSHPSRKEGTKTSVSISNIWGAWA